MTIAIQFQRERKLGHVLWILTLCHNVVMKQHSKTLLLWTKKGRLSSHWGEYGIFFQNALCFIMNTTITSHYILLSLQAFIKASQKSVAGNGNTFRCWTLISEEDTIHPSVSWGEIGNVRSVTRLGTTVQLPGTKWHCHKAGFFWWLISSWTFCKPLLSWWSKFFFQTVLAFPMPRLKWPFTVSITLPETSYSGGLLYRLCFPETI